jgi:GPH family glycoside/pentoside/hexuronide:cation symporter
MEPKHVITPSDKVPLKTRVGWGFGGLADTFIISALNDLVMPVYNIAFGIDPVRIGFALFVSRFFGAVADNSRTPWGRRRPYIAAGAILSGVLLPLLWMPFAKTDFGMFLYLMITATLYSLIYTLYIVPYTALGYELTRDYDERTNVLAWRMYIGLIGAFTVPWLYKFCLLPVFGGDVAVGAQWVSIGLGVIIVGTGILPAIACKEHTETQQQDKINIRKALCCTLRNRPFIILLVAYIVVIFGLFSSSTLLLYINIYHVCGGNKASAATITGLSGSLGAITAYISLPLITFVSTHWGKRNAMIIGLALGTMGVISLWFTMTPVMPYLQLISYVVIGLGLQGSWLMISSMVADICDEDEIETGLRREGVYGAVNGLAFKGAWALSALAGGIFLKMSGYEAINVEKLGLAAPSVMLKMRLLFIIVQCVSLIVAMVLFLFYPITRNRAEKTRRVLDDRHRHKVALVCHDSNANTSSAV